MSLAERMRPQKINEMILSNNTREELRAIETIIKQDPSRIRGILLIGPSGYGKTTAARILSKLILDTTDANALRFNVMEINAANTRGIDSARDIADFVSTSSIFSARKVVIIDEAQQLTKEAQNCLLKPMEDSPNSCVIICSTDPSKLLPTIKTRCMKIDIHPFDQSSHSDVKAISDFLDNLAKKDGIFLNVKLYEEIAKSYPNSIRAFINKVEILDAAAVKEFDERAKQLITDNSFDGDEKAETLVRDIVRLVMDKDKFDTKEKIDKWKQIASLIQTIKDQPESIRIRISAYTCKALANFNTTNFSINTTNAFIALGRLLNYCTSVSEITKEQLLSIVYKTIFFDELFNN